MQNLKWGFLGLLLIGCSHSGELDHKIKAKKNLEKLTSYFHEIQSSEDFKNKSLHIKNELDLLADNLIELKKNSYSQEQREIKLINFQKDKFEYEFNRVMQINGCKELYEQSSQDALYKLDAFERKLAFPQHLKPKKKKIEPDS